MPQVQTSDPQKSAQNTALFMECVSMYSHQAMISMGKIVNPFTKKAEKNLEAARLFIDMLEMLEAKTKGNLIKDEERLLATSLGGLRLTFVEEVQSGTKEEAPKENVAEAETKAEPAEQTPPPAEPAKADESKKKFTKKYE
jgi:hypothetical protein